MKLKLLRKKRLIIIQWRYEMSDSESIINEVMLSEIREMKRELKDTNINAQKAQAQTVITQITVEQFQKENISSLQEFRKETRNSLEEFRQEFKEVIYGNEEKHEVGLKQTVNILYSDFKTRKITQKICVGIVTITASVYAWLTTYIH